MSWHCKYFCFRKRDGSAYLGPVSSIRHFLFYDSRLLIPCKYLDSHKIVIWYYDIKKIMSCFFLGITGHNLKYINLQISISNCKYQAGIILQISFSYRTMLWRRIISWLRFGFVKSNIVPGNSRNNSPLILLARFAFHQQSIYTSC